MRKINKRFNIYPVMYHYVREIKKSRYPNLKGLEFKKFQNQISFFKKNFNILSPLDFLEVVESKKLPKKKSIILTFDDGYKDHYKFVFPYLVKNKISAAFYVPSKLLSDDKEILIANKIQFILEKNVEKKKIFNLINKKLNLVLNDDIKNYLKYKKNISSRFDDVETIFLKLLLQKILPEKIRNKIVNDLFKKFVTPDFKKFHEELYLSKKEMNEMSCFKMHFGSHSHSHHWLNNLSKIQQHRDILKSINILKRNTHKDNFMSFTFPYGGYNKSTLKVLNDLDIKFAFTDQYGGLNRYNIKNKFTIPRFDTNDL